MNKLTIGQIEKRLQELKEDDEVLINQLLNDERKGVRQLVLKWQKHREQEKLFHNKFIEMSQYEQTLRQQGFCHIAGIDEVGRGPLAGPVVAAAVILPENFYLPGIDDSKKLTEQKREIFYEQITEQAVSFHVGIISSEEIDRINIFEATKKAMLAAICGLDPKPDFLLIDAVDLNTPYPCQSIVKGDAKSVSIAAASIIAKVTRDRMMKEIGKLYPGYGFENNMGYGTKEHLEAIKKLGATPYHRKSFAPIKDFFQN
jgi:ribonuclease HII